MLRTAAYTTLFACCVSIPPLCGADTDLAVWLFALLSLCFLAALSRSFAIRAFGLLFAGAFGLFACYMGYMEGGAPQSQHCAGLAVLLVLSITYIHYDKRRI